MKGEIVRATEWHAADMAGRVRRAEVREVWDSHGMDMITAIRNELSQSTVAWSWIVDGQVACMFGIVLANMLGDAFPWFLSTNLVDVHSFAFAKACKRLLPELLETHPKLIGMVDNRYALSIRWLEWLGAKIGEPERHGVNFELFRRFEIGQ